MPNVDNSWYLKSTSPNFKRDQFKTKSDMLNYPSKHIDDGHISYCVEDGIHYVWQASNQLWTPFMTTASIEWVEE